MRVNFINGNGVAVPTYAKGVCVMLVIGRKKGDKVIIKTPEGRVVEVTIVRVKGVQTRLGFKCENEVFVGRAENAARHLAMYDENPEGWRKK